MLLSNVHAVLDFSLYQDKESDKAQIENNTYNPKSIQLNNAEKIFYKQIRFTKRNQVSINPRPLKGQFQK
jgi:hypothetical protein